jgi:hypothetical protein
MRFLVVLVFLPLFAFAQNETWPKVFWKYKVTYNFDLIETYDKGYLLVNTIRPDGITEIWTWLVKTDINGEILWEKIIGDGIHNTGFHSVYQTEDGGYILSGGTYLLDNEHGDSFIMKLNACGEKEWCRIFFKAGNTTSYDFCMNTYSVPGEGGYISLVMQWGDEFVPGIYKGIWLFRLDDSGNSVWIKNIFNEVDPDAWNELPYHMFISQDTNCIITGSIIYFDNGGSFGYSKPFIMAAGMDGSEKWWIIDGANSQNGGYAQRSVEDSSGNILTVGWGYLLLGGGGEHPMLLKTDKYGNQIYRKYIIDSTDAAQAKCITLINDTLYDIGGGWSYPGQPPHAAIARTDTNGNLILEKNVMETDWALNSSIKTFDNKELFIGSFKDSDNFYKVCLHKFNFDLEYDIAYTQAFEYDYKCDNLPIVTDTIGIDDCDVWTGLPEETEYEEAEKLVVYPSPAENEITIKLPAATVDEHQWGQMTSRQYNYRYHENSVLKIFDIYGRLVEEISLKDIEGNKLIKDVSGYKSGIYLVNLFESQKLMASGKFVKK